MRRGQLQATARVSEARHPGLSFGEAAALTREKYRYAHCTMNNNANRNVCK